MMIKINELKSTPNEELKSDNASVRKSLQGSHKSTVVPSIKIAKLPINKLKPISTHPILVEEITSPLNTIKPEIYQERKRMLPEYKDLFAALLRLPDKKVQKKIFDVINNHKSIEFKNVETQTDSVEITYPKNIKEETSGQDTLILNGPSTDNGIAKCGDIRSDDEPPIEQKKRKRRRKVSLPQANKESRAKQLVKMNKPKSAISDYYLSRTLLYSSNTLNLPKRQRIDSIFSECGSDVAHICEDVETNPSIEFATSGVLLGNGLLPIQDAVIKNQIKKLNIHINIWKNYRKLDLNELVTDDDEDLLQLAVINSSDPSIVNLLLEQGINTDCLDADSNTIIHLAILNDINVTSMELLMKSIDLKLLLTLNDEGYTPLHLAIRRDRFLLAECLINVLDKRLTNNVFYKRKFDELETDEVLKKQFKSYYEKVCLQMNVDEESDLHINKDHNLKKQLLQIGDRRSGNTALYFAIDNKYEHLIYFLLAHLTDPRTKNLSGQNCKTFLCEFGRSLNLSLNIDNTMENVIKILSKKTA